MVRLVAVALQAHPRLNALWENEALHVLPDVDMGIAVDTEDGLLVPVLRQAQTKGVRQIAEEARSLIERARLRQLAPDLLQGGSFTLTNLGMYGIDAFTPLLNLPQCAVLGVGRIAARPAVHEGQVVPRPRMALSLTFDHRAVDGGPAARFLDAVRQYVEQPALWLAE
jgi:pyruvate dehydrogenase E2 component (dihydrolipoamide acetyltransferase)